MDGVDANGHPMPPRAFRWVSIDSSIATVDSAGLVTVAGNGSATVTVESGDIRAGVEVTVYDHQAALAENRDVLMILYDATRGDAWRNGSNENWGSEKPLDAWSGVSTAEDGRVTGLALYANRLFGILPPELGKLGRLETLHLQSLTKLKALNLVNSGVSDPLPPEFGNLSSLTSLMLGSDYANSPMPVWLGKLSHLEFLEIRGGGMTGPIPPELGNLVNLKQLQLLKAGLIGSIPPELGDLPKLEFSGLGRE